jgi:hypothetical protein
MFFRGANSIEGRGSWFFRKIFLSLIRTKKILWDELNSGIENVPVIDSICWCGAKKNEKFEFFRFFVNFS